MINVPRATYRLQINSDFTFFDAGKIADYLSLLGISHVYLSPFLEAVEGSVHGYDIVNPAKVSKERGGKRGLNFFYRVISRYNIGQILDVVPNHMAINSPDNIWWQDVLENGRASPYADYFDINWEPLETRFKHKILLPVLFDHYGEELEKGEISLQHKGGNFFIKYKKLNFSASPASIALLLSDVMKTVSSKPLRTIVNQLEALPDLTGKIDKAENVYNIIKPLKIKLQSIIKRSPRITEAVNSAVEKINQRRTSLNEFLDAQNYRLAFWRSAFSDIGFRRFFDITSLVGLHMEKFKVFSDTHQLIGRWLKNGMAAGLRIDHIDGLYDPEQYLQRLRRISPEAWIVAEKILLQQEKLPASWPIQGTTGYNFLNLTLKLFADAKSKKFFNRFYAKYTGLKQEYQELLKEAKLLVLNELLASSVNRITELLVEICEKRRRYRDYTRQQLREALCAFIACFPVYRSYVRFEQKTFRHDDWLHIQRAIKRAKTMIPQQDHAVFNLLNQLLGLKYSGELERQFVMRLQQLTAAAMAKGLEDTAFYRFNCFAAFNEVGGDPMQFGISAKYFHAVLENYSKSHPFAMLSTSTHDTKRSEDVRARLAILSEIPKRWGSTIIKWTKYHEQKYASIVPARNDLYLFYQNLIGAWPIDKERMAVFMLKAVREAKVKTSWLNPNLEYEKKLSAFVDSVFADKEFCEMIKKFVEPLISFGRVNSLAQTLLKLTAPGVPDIYQGTELWDLSLVDPDNRRPVDFAARKKLLNELQHLSIAQIMKRMDEGLPKLWLISQTLQLRKKMPEHFAAANYQPIKIHGAKAKHGFAFSRNGTILAFVPRLVKTLGSTWGSTNIVLPEGEWKNAFTSENWRCGKLKISQLLAKFPVALLIKEK